MLTQMFSTILEESITVSLVIALVIVTRFMLSKSPKVFSYALWGVVLFRLVCPFTLESEYGLIPSATPTQVELVAPSYESFTPIIPTPTPTTTPTYTPSVEVQTNQEVEKTPIDWYSIASYIWLIGVAVMLGFGVREFVQLNKSLIGCTRWKDCQYGENIYLCDNIKSPFVMGIFAKIYIPSNIMNKDLDYIISHEKHHIKRLDHITRIIGFIVLSVHWFNPFVWIAFVLSGKDMELSCDEYVLGRADNSSVDIRADYSQALLYFACNLNCRRKLLAITPHAFGESGSTKERIVNIMTYKKTAVWVSVLLAGLVGFTSVALASDKVNQEVQEVPAPPASPAPVEKISTAGTSSDFENTKTMEFTIDENNTILQLTETPEPQELLNFIYPIEDLNLTILNENNTPITNANVIITPLYVTDKPYESYLVTDNNGVAVGQLNDMFPTGEYKIEAWLTAEQDVPALNGYEKAYVNQMITSDNYENLVVTMPTTSENKDKYLFSNRIDIYVVDINEKPISNALVEIKPAFPIPAISTTYGFDTFNRFGYTDNDGRVTFDNVIQGDYMMNYWYDLAYPGSALITSTDGIDEYIFTALYENE